MLIFLKAMLKNIVDYGPVDWSGRHSTPAGYSGKGETPQEQSDEEAHLTPRGKRVPAAEINTLN
jgi:hypothetical protein